MKVQNSAQTLGIRVESDVFERIMVGDDAIPAPVTNKPINIGDKVTLVEFSAGKLTGRTLGATIAYIVRDLLNRPAYLMLFQRKVKRLW